MQTEIAAEQIKERHVWIIDRGRDPLAVDVQCLGYRHRASLRKLACAGGDARADLAATARRPCMALAAPIGESRHVRIRRLRHRPRHGYAMLCCATALLRKLFRFLTFRPAATEVLLARSDIIVLGAGIVGTSIALHLVKRGLSVTLIDRGEPGRGTSYGNAGIIEGNTVFPAAFPASLKELARIALKRSTLANYHLGFLL